MRTQRSNTTITGALFVGLALVACDPKILLGGFDSETGEGSGDPVSSGGTEGESSTGGGSGGDTGGATTAVDTGGATTGAETGGGDTGAAETSGTGTTGEPGEPACDPWLQDCPSGQKCAPYWTGNDGPTHDAFHCVDLDPDPQPVGSACHVSGEYHSGEDDCETGAVCWDVDPQTFDGACVALCEGSPQSPECASGTHCVSLNDGVFNICLLDCDPLLQDCADGEACIPVPNDLDTFVCVLDAGGAEGQAFDTCEFANACDPGLMCAPPESASECSPTDPGCCIPFCDLGAANTCPGVDQECLPWFAPGQAPPGQEDVGICGLEP